MFALLPVYWEGVLIKHYLLSVMKWYIYLSHGFFLYVQIHVLYLDF